MNDVKRVGDYTGQRIEGEPITLDEVVGMGDVLVVEIAERQGEHGTYLIVGLMFGGERFTFTTGGTVVCRKLLAVQEHLPLLARFCKPGRYYDVA